MPSYTICVILCFYLARFTTASSKHYITENIQVVWETDKDGFLIPPIDDNAEQNKTSELGKLAKQVGFFLWSRNNPGTPVTDQGGKNSNLRIFGRYPQLPLKVLVHGWMANSSTDWVKMMTAAMMKRPRKVMNVVVVNWGDLANDNRYYQSSSSTEPVGRRLGEFLFALVDQGFVRAKDIHIIGHSLGAHVAGVAGHVFTVLSEHKKIGRITGLDPAKPGYELAEESEMLTKDDADFIDVIHTTAGTSGIFQPEGHVDFYPNGGANQPGCEGYSPQITSYLESISCSHMRVCELYMESIIDSKAFIAKKCPDGVSIPPKKEDCVNGTIGIMGENCPVKTKGVYFLETNEKPPFHKK